MGVRRELLVARALGLPLYELQDGKAVPIGQRRADELMAAYLGRPWTGLPFQADAPAEDGKPGGYMAVDEKTGAQKGQKRARFDLLPWPEVRQVLRRRQEGSCPWLPIDAVQKLVYWWERRGWLLDESVLEWAGAIAMASVDGGISSDEIDAAIMWQLAEVYGANAKPVGKYEPRNWEKGMAWSVLFAAAMRHGVAAMQGEELDKDDGLPHMIHFLWHCVGLLFYMHHGLGTDDRPAVPPVD